MIRPCLLTRLLLQYEIVAIWSDTLNDDSLGVIQGNGGNSILEPSQGFVIHMLLQWPDLSHNQLSTT